MHRLHEQLHNPATRRHVLTVLSGAFVLAALVLEHVLGRESIADPLMIAAAVIAGSDIAARAFSALRLRQMSIELLVTVAASGAIIIGDYWEAAAVTFLFVLGANLEARTLNRTRRALQSLIELAPVSAIVMRDDQQVEIAAADVEIGETVVVKPGARVPVDGQVLAGRAAVDQSSITGESMPVEKSVDDAVFAGTISVDGALRVRATGVGADTTLAHVIRRVEEAQEAQAPTQRFIERFARWYTPVIMALSTASWLITRDVELALTLLVIGCPGALVISTPVSVVAGIGRAARSGILIKGGQFLENAGKISAIAFDKTGTLTRGRPELTDVIALQSAPAEGAAVSDPLVSAWDRDQAEILRWAAIAEIDSEHPLARPIVTAATSTGAIPHADEFTVHTGRGVSASYEGHTVAVGSAKLMRELDTPVESAVEAHALRLKSEGKTAVIVAVDGEPIGLLGIADSLRAETPAAIAALRRAGVDHIVMLTGDGHPTAEAIAARAGITDIAAELMPDQKLDAIRALQRDGHVVAMVGDGINDAPALAAADIGIAMGVAGTDVAIETADIALVSDDLRKVPAAIAISKATMRNIRQNVVIALVAVSALLAGVLIGRVDMAGGMLVHEGSVLIVILNGMRLMREPRANHRGADQQTGRDARLEVSTVSMA
jgi:Cd2+/Zn2+-exporting ATPase